MLRRRSLLLAGAALACGRAPAPARHTFAETRDTVAELVDVWRGASPIVGVSVALVADGELAWAAGFGPADREAERPAAPDTVYAIGSLTKPLTALAAVHAASRGHLDLDAPLRALVPELRSGDPGLTVRQVLCHRSGLLSDWHRGSMGDPIPDWRALAAEIADEPALAPPDTWTAYSNVAYTLLGLALERAVGEPFEPHLERTARDLLGPVGFAFRPPSTLAATYCAGRREPEPTLRLVPAAGLHASVLDLAALLRLLLAGGDLATAMLTPQPAGPLDFDERWGLGLALRHVQLDHAGRVAWHAGRTFGHRAFLALLPDHGLGVAVLANAREAGGVEDLGVAALQTALLERHGVDLPPTRGDAEVGPPAALDPAALRANLGRYATDHDVVTISAGDAGLVSRSELGTTTLTPAGDGGFTSAGNLDARVRFVARADHLCLTSTVRGLATRLGVRCPEGPVPEDWRARLGTYRVDAPPGEALAFTAAHLELADGVLSLRLESPQPSAPSSTLARYALVPAGAGEARVFGVGRGKGQRVRLLPDGLTWAGYRLVPA